MDGAMMTYLFVLAISLVGIAWVQWYKRRHQRHSR